MLHIFLTILKIPFILLAIILLLLLAVLLLLLFVPVRYQAQADMDGRPQICGRVHWLLHLISLRADYRGDGLQFKIKILGIPLNAGRGDAARLPSGEESVQEEEDLAPEPEKPSLQKLEEDVSPDADAQPLPQQAAEDIQPEAEEPSPQKLEEDVLPDADAQPQQQPTEDIPPEPEEPSPQKPEPAAPPEEAPRRVGLLARIRAVFEKIKNTFRTILEKIQHIRENAEKLKKKIESWRHLWYDEHTQKSVAQVKKEVFYLLKHYLPGKLEGSVYLGLGDPALTGQALGILSIVQVFTGNHLSVEADFEKKVFKGTLRFKGHVRLCHIVKSLLGLLFSRHCRVTLKRFRNLAHQGK